MLRRTPIRSMSDKRRAMLAANGIKHLSSTLVAIGRSDTGPSRRVRRLVAKRSGGWCEFPGCTDWATDMHHRLNRKAGGRHGEMGELLNESHWLLHCCRAHHVYVTSPAGHHRRTAMALGWLLLEGQDAAEVRVRIRQHPEPVLLTDDGRWEA